MVGVCRVLAWIAVGLVTCASRSAGEEFAPVPEPAFPAPIDWMAEPTPDAWPAGTVEATEKPGLVSWMSGLPEWVFRHEAPNHPHRHRGLGEPLSGTSWRNRPWHVGWLVGGLFGDDLIEDQVEQAEDLFGGYRLGYDFDHYWGWEGRFAFAHLEIDDGQLPPHPRTARDWFLDANMLYYPWGDARWRPYLGVGMGLGNFRFEDAQGVRYRETLFQIPLGVGVKYLYQRWLALRLDATHNFAFAAAGLDTMDNFSLTAGVEVHFGGRRRSYFPW